MVYVADHRQTQRDLLVMEAIAIPLSFLVLVWVFGGLLAAALPWRSACWRSWVDWRCCG